MSEDIPSPKMEPTIEVAQGSITLYQKNAREIIARTLFYRREQEPRSQNQLVIKNFDVVPRYQEQGYGSMLMSEVKKILVQENRQGILSVHADNARAQAFYQSQGWEFEDELELPSPGQRASHLQRWMVYDVSQ